MATTIQLKRGSALAWSKLNPVLAVGEPGFEKDTGRLKIGNGLDTWNNLPYQDERGNLEIYSADTVEDFPRNGDANLLYRASKTAKLYQWNPDFKYYEPIIGGGSSEGGGSFEDIKIINGGNA